MCTRDLSRDIYQVHTKKLVIHAVFGLRGARGPGRPTPGGRGPRETVARNIWCALHMLDVLHREYTTRHSKLQLLTESTRDLARPLLYISRDLAQKHVPQELPGPLHHQNSLLPARTPLSHTHPSHPPRATTQDRRRLAVASPPPRHSLAVATSSRPRHTGHGPTGPRPLQWPSPASSRRPRLSHTPAPAGSIDARRGSAVPAAS